MKYGDVVRPNAEALRVTNYREESRLVVRRNRGGGDRHCVACIGVQMERWRARGSDWMGTSDARARVGLAAEPGAMYAAGKESSCPLCLGHVEALENQVKENE